MAVSRKGFGRSSGPAVPESGLGVGQQRRDAEY